MAGRGRRGSQVQWLVGSWRSVNVVILLGDLALIEEAMARHSG